MDWDDRNRGSIAIRAVAPTQSARGLARIGAVTMALAGLAAILAPPAGAVLASVGAAAIARARVDARREAVAVSSHLANVRLVDHWSQVLTKMPHAGPVRVWSIDPCPRCGASGLVVSAGRMVAAWHCGRLDVSDESIPVPEGMGDCLAS